MYCEKYIDNGILYLYGELEKDEQLAFESHLKNCKSCQAELAVLEHSKKLSQLIPEEDIAPFSITEYNYQQDNWFMNKLFTAINTAKLFIQTKPRLVLASSFVITLGLIIVYLLRPPIPANLEVTKWDAGLEESLNSIDQRIANFKSEDIFDTQGFSEVFVPDDMLSDERIDQIEEDIQLISQELNSLEF